MARQREGPEDRARTGSIETDLEPIECIYVQLSDPAGTSAPGRHSMRLADSRRPVTQHSAQVRDQKLNRGDLLEESEETPASELPVPTSW
ncbi:hypothetical protein BDZ91DRAFT_798493 [Kalaharituber pfeilii]|nr:hypothetical protein BDZ91DRAFT_798493 [Kalaharituber pfeilii]